MTEELDQRNLRVDLIDMVKTQDLPNITKTPGFSGAPLPPDLQIRPDQYLLSATKNHFPNVNRSSSSSHEVVQSVWWCESGLGSIRSMAVEWQPPVNYRQLYFPDIHTSGDEIQNLAHVPPVRRGCLTPTVGRPRIRFIYDFSR